MMFAGPIFSDALDPVLPPLALPAEAPEMSLPPDRPRRDGPIGPAVAWLHWPGTTITQIVGLLYVDTRLSEAKVRLWHLVPGRAEIDYAETFLPLTWLSFERPK